MEKEEDKDLVSDRWWLHLKHQPSWVRKRRAFSLVTFLRISKDDSFKQRLELEIKDCIRAFIHREVKEKMYFVEKFSLAKAFFVPSHFKSPLKNSNRKKTQ